LKIIPNRCDWKSMTSKLPTSPVLSISGRRTSLAVASAGKQRGPGLWTGTREGLVSTVIVMAAAMLFGGSAGLWFAPGGESWLEQAIRMAAGSFVMAVLVSLTGSLIAGRNAIYWGVGMPLIAYGAGAFCALISGHAGSAMFFFGAPVFCGLAVLGGLIAALAVDRGILR
jgi:hypothetical protein